MKKLIIFLMFLSSFSYAQGKSAFLKQGTPAPFDGILLDSQSQAEMIANSEYEKKKCALDCDYNLLKMRAESDLTIAKLKVDVDIANQKFDTIMKIKDDEIKRANEIAVKESSKSNYWIYWFVGGIVAGAGMSIGISYAINH